MVTPEYSDLRAERRPRTPIAAGLGLGLLACRRGIHAIRRQIRRLYSPR